MSIAGSMDTFFGAVAGVFGIALLFAPAMGVAACGFFAVTGLAVEAGFVVVVGGLPVLVGAPTADMLSCGCTVDVELKVLVFCGRFAIGLGLSTAAFAFCGTVLTTGAAGAALLARAVVGICFCGELFALSPPTVVAAFLAGGSFCTSGPGFWFDRGENSPLPAFDARSALSGNATCCSTYGRIALTYCCIIFCCA